MTSKIVRRRATVAQARRCRWRAWTPAELAALEPFYEQIFDVANKLGRDPTSIANRLYRTLAVEPKLKLTAEDWIAAARASGKIFHVKLTRILNGDTHQVVIAARHRAFRILRDLGATNTQIALISGFDNSTIYYALRAKAAEQRDQQHDHDNREDDPTNHLKRRGEHT